MFWNNWCVEGYLCDGNTFWSLLFKETTKSNDGNSQMMFVYKRDIFCPWKLIKMLKCANIQNRILDHIQVEMRIKPGKRVVNFIICEWTWLDKLMLFFSSSHLLKYFTVNRILSETHRIRDWEALLSLSITVTIRTHNSFKCFVQIECCGNKKSYSLSAYSMDC